MIKIDLSKFDLNPIKQPEITPDTIRHMLAQTPRRKQIKTEGWEALHRPSAKGNDWRLVLPFEATFANAFRSMCEVETIGFRETNERCWTFLCETSENGDCIDKVRAWLETVSPFVALRDCLAASFAIDYDREAGDPARPQTEVGELRSKAKIYDGTSPNSTNLEAADRLADICVDTLNQLRCYESVDAVVGMPPSRPDKPFDLPRHLAARIADAVKKPDLTSAVRTTQPRPGLKETPVEDKLSVLEGTIEVDSESIEGKSILLVDDLYQSGVSMNYVGMLLLEHGAKRVFGLACEKTCRNDDNVSGRADEK